MKLKFPFLFVGLLVIVAGSANATESLQVSDAWIPEAPPVASVMAGYLTIHNPGKQAVTITGARSKEFAAVEIHETRMQDGMARMVRQASLVIPAGASVKFERGGLHLMLMQPKRGFKAGDSISIELVTDAGMLVVNANVRAANLDDDMHHHHNH